MSLQKVLVKLPNYAGDIVMCLPALSALRSVFPKAHGYSLHFLTEKKRADLVAHTTISDSVLAPDWGAHDVIPLRVAALLRETGPYDIGVLFTRQWRFSAGFKLARIPIRIGYNSFPSGLFLSLTDPREATPPLSSRDQSDQYLDLVRIAATQITHTPVPDRQEPRLRLAESWKSQTMERLGRAMPESYCLVMPGSSNSRYGRTKRWPVQRFVAAAQMVCEAKSELTAVFVFSADEMDLHGQCQELLQGTPIAARIILLQVGLLEWRHIMTLISGAMFVLANDSGPRHVAAAMQRKVISVFGPTDLNRFVYSAKFECPVRVNVGCNDSECKVRRCRRRHICMCAVTPRMVVEAIDKFVFRESSCA